MERSNENLDTDAGAERVQTLPQVLISTVANNRFSPDGQATSFQISWKL